MDQARQKKRGRHRKEKFAAGGAVATAIALAVQQLHATAVPPHPLASSSQAAPATENGPSPSAAASTPANIFPSIYGLSRTTSPVSPTTSEAMPTLPVTTSASKPTSTSAPALDVTAPNDSPEQVGSFLVQGAGFPASQPLWLYAGNTTPTEVVTDEHGAFSATVVVPVLTCKSPAEPVQFVVRTESLEVLYDLPVDLLTLVSGVLQCAMSIL